MAELDVIDNGPSWEDKQMAWNWAMMVQLSRIYDVLIALLPEDDQEVMTEFHKEGKTYCPPPRLNEDEIYGDQTPPSSI